MKESTKKLLKGAGLVALGIGSVPVRIGLYVSAKVQGKVARPPLNVFEQAGKWIEDGESDFIDGLDLKKEGK